MSGLNITEKCENVLVKTVYYSSSLLEKVPVVRALSSGAAFWSGDPSTAPFPGAGANTFHRDAGEHLQSSGGIRALHKENRCKLSSLSCWRSCKLRVVNIQLESRDWVDFIEQVVHFMGRSLDTLIWWEHKCRKSQVSRAAPCVCSSHLIVLQAQEKVKDTLIAWAFFFISVIAAVESRVVRSSIRKAEMLQRHLER